MDWILSSGLRRTEHSIGCDYSAHKSHDIFRPTNNQERLQSAELVTETLR